MPTQDYTDGYNAGFLAALDLRRKEKRDPLRGGRVVATYSSERKPKRKLSAWNKFVKANSKKKIFQYANGKLKLKKMGIAFRKTPAGRKK